MDATLKAPYFAPKERLPAPLPTEKEIRAATQVFKSNFSRIVRIGPYVVKHGTKVDLMEGENMLFVRETEKRVHVPEVFALYSIVSKLRGKTENYIVMEYIEGENLEDLWSHLTAREKSVITGQLRGYMDLLRNIPVPGYFGSLAKKPYKNSWFLPALWTEPLLNAELNGPFYSGPAFVEAIVKRLVRVINNEHRGNFYRRVLPSVLTVDPNPVFTYGNLGRMHVIRKRDGTLVLIDWAMAGWYPMWFDYAMATIFAERWEDDWNDYLVQILDEYPTQFLWLRTVLAWHMC